MDGLESDQEKSGVETSEWLNVLIQQVGGHDLGAIDARPLINSAAIDS